ncbi:MAG: putative DNA modification/repair radical SAM protein [Firmicutes bacterium]|nr:putative DNA modification/repair radical SAM protein [Bacillota bacterium]
MVNIIMKQSLSRDEKIALMQQDARFDVSDDDNACVPDLSFIKDKIKGRPNPPKVPKVFMSNDCIFNCAYCFCRSGLDIRRYTVDPKELAKISVEEAIKNGHGVFLTSGIYKNPDYTEELIIETIKSIRVDYGYKGYVHAKIMPGTSPELIWQAGLYANRIDVNIEVAKNEGYKQIARNKNKKNILTPMGLISQFIRANKEERQRYRHAPKFATSQTTQLMPGSTNETDFEILRLANAMYKKYGLARVYYSPFHYTHEAKGYPGLPNIVTPVWRMKRLYQADRLMQLYGFTPDELAPEAETFLSSELDPKAAWALRHMHLYPIEVNTADYEMLLRIPGIGTTYAARIIKARKYCKVTHDVLRALGVSLKRSVHFMTCNGKFLGARSDGIDVYRQLLVTPMGMELNQVEDCVV